MARSWLSLTFARSMGSGSRVLRTLIAIGLLLAGCATATESRYASTTPSAGASASLSSKPPVIAVVRASDNTVWLLDADGAAVRQLVGDGPKNGLSWSPDGQTIAIAWDQGKGGPNGSSDIYVVGVDGGRPRQVTDSGGACCPEWAPSGARLAYSNGSTRVIDLDGSHDGSLISVASAEHGTWSPDGRRFTFMSYQHDDWDIWVVGIDGSGLRNLTNAPGYQAVPAWSPDGKTIAFGADPGARGTRELSQAHVYVMDTGGSNVRQITDDASARDGFPAWLPDGRLSFERVTFANGLPTIALWVTKADGSEAQKFADDVAWAAWRPSPP